MLNNSRSSNQKISSLVSDFAKIYISEKAYMQMSYIIKNSDIEVGWLATVNKDQNNYYIEECFLVEQEAHATTCELKEEALNNFALSLIESNDIETYDKLKCWCHSHVNMGVTPSGQDDKQMELFKDNDYFIRGIGNKKGDMKFDIFNYKDNLLVEDVPWEITRDKSILDRIKILKAELALLTTIEDKTLEDNIKLELKDKVKKKTYGNSLTSYKYYDYRSKGDSKTSYSSNKSNHNFIFDKSSNSYKDFECDNLKKYTFTKNSSKSESKYYDDLTDISYDDYDYSFNYLQSDSKTSVFDYFLYDELEEAYKSADYNYNKMAKWVKQNVTGITDDEAYDYVEEFLETAY